MQVCVDSEEGEREKYGYRVHKEEYGGDTYANQKMAPTSFRNASCKKINVEVDKRYGKGKWRKEPQPNDVHV